MAALPESINRERQENHPAHGSHGQVPRGLSTKIHAVVDALGNLIRLILTPGQASEYGIAPALLEGFSPQAVLGDKR